MLKVYTFTWSVVLMIGAVLFLSGNFTMLAAVVFGFIAFGLIFTGMMCVLPSMVGHDRRTDNAINVTPIFSAVGKGVRNVGQFAKQWFAPSGVEMRKPRFHS